MDIIRNFISEYGVSILYSILTALAGYIGIAIKNIYQKYINDKTKKDIAATCVRAIEQIYTDLHGREKFDKCVEAAAEMLASRGIEISEIEIKMLIEAAVNEMNEKMGDLTSDMEIICELDDDIDEVEIEEE